jgi:hypothetical protein
MNDSSPIRYIYTISSSREPNRIRYIGQTNDVRGRIWKHRSDMSKYINLPLYRWMNSVVSNGFEILYTVEFCSSATKIDDLEYELIRYFGKCSLLNLSEGGDSRTGYVFTPEQLEKIKINTRKGMNAPGFRKKMQPQWDSQKKQIRDSLGNSFNGVAEAAKFHGLSYETTRFAAKNNLVVKGIQFSYS